MVSEDDLQSAARACRGDLGLVLEEQEASGDGKPVKEPPLPTKTLCQDGCWTKKRKKRKTEKGVSGTGDFGSSLLLSLTTDHAAIDEHELSHQLESSVLAVEANKRSMPSSAVATEDGNGAKWPKKDAQATSTSRRSHVFSINLLEKEIVAANKMFADMSSAQRDSHKMKCKTKKDCNGNANNLPSEDVLDNPSSRPNAVMFGKKQNKKNNINNTQGKISPFREVIGVGLSEDVRPHRNNRAASTLVGSTVSTYGSCMLQKYGQYGIIRGKRYSKEEDQLIIDAASQYIERNKLGKEGFHMILKCKKYPQITKGCWNEIAASIPWRLRKAVRRRAEKLFLNDLGHKWTPNEIEFLKRYVREHGKRWKSVAELLGVHWEQACRVWKRNSNPNFRLGPWSQHECQQLFDMVHKDLLKKAFIENNDKYCRLRENISWTEISNKMGTRYDTHICQKWCRSLSSSMVSQGLWSETDDYHLIDRLLKLDVYCMEDVDWDNLLVNRSGTICRKRWMEMTKHIGGNIEKPFMEQVELLSTRYSIDMLEYRERALEQLS